MDRISYSLQNCHVLSLLVLLLFFPIFMVLYYAVFVWLSHSLFKVPLKSSPKKPFSIPRLSRYSSTA